MRINDIKLKPRLITLFLLIGLVPVVVVGWWSAHQASQALMEQSYHQLQSMREVKAERIKEYFSTKRHDLNVLVETVDVLRVRAIDSLAAVREAKKSHLETYFNSIWGFLNDAANSSRFSDSISALTFRFLVDGASSDSYQQLFQLWHEEFESLRKVYDFKDILLIEPDGVVVYSHGMQSILGQNVMETASGAKALAKSFAQGKQGIHFTDFSWVEYTKSPAAFYSVPIHDAGDNFLGVAVFQLGTDQINEIMKERSGLGETGETYLVGTDNLMRSDSYLDPENRSVSASLRHPAQGKVDTEATRLAFQGQVGADIVIDYNGNQVLSAWTQLKVGEVTWALLAEIDMAEAFAPESSKGTPYYENYMKLYGFYDLFLINPEGYVFYTVVKEPDYQTNLVNGPYASSNLGELFRKVRDTGSYQFADFAPYAPSNGQPAAFIAQPLMHGTEVELVVALQIPLSKINAFMQQREGMGQTGETYLVGPDYRMRSDSYLDPAGHSVEASFAGTVEQNGVRTLASEKALAGERGAEVVMDYNGNPVLSAYAPVNVEGLTWALLADIDEAEVLQPINDLTTTILLMGLMMVLLVLVLAYLVANGIAQPVIKVKDLVQRVSAGDLTVEHNIVQQDEVGILAQSMSQMTAELNRIVADVQEATANMASGSEQLSSSSQEMSQGATEQAASVEQTSASMEEMASNIQKSSENAHETERLSRQAAVDAQSSSATVGKAMNAMREIADKINIISEIARQTNLLALNAAIEAARAGEEGKGFAVVAAEVRKLAERSHASAQEITELSQGSKELADQSNQQLTSLVEAITKTADLMQEINAATTEQSEGVEQVNRALRQLDQVIQQNASSSEQIASSAENLSAQAQVLQEAMSFFRTENSKRVQPLAEPLKTHISGFITQTKIHIIH